MEYTTQKLCMMWLTGAQKLAKPARDRLLQTYGSAEEVFAAFSDKVMRIVGEGAYLELEKGREKGLLYLPGLLAQLKAYAVMRGEPGYPKSLVNIPDAPEILYVMGEIPNAPSVCVVGSRHNTRYGAKMARQIATCLAKSGVTVVSGLARGIDTAAHVGALGGGGKTVAVMGSGFMNLYPPENRVLAENIIKCGGALVTEYPPEAQPLSFHFPFRNRIISGLSDALVLIEAELRSGTMSTVNHALNQGKTVFALPGNVDAPTSALPLKLLKEGAQMCTCGEDILEALGLPCGAQQAPPQKHAPDDIVAALQREEKTFNELVRETGLTPQALSIRLSELELDGVIRKLSGNAFGLL